MQITKDFKADWQTLLKAQNVLKELIASYPKDNVLAGKPFLPEFKPIVQKSEFLVPAYIMWRKDVDTDDLLESETISPAAFADGQILSDSSGETSLFDGGLERTGLSWGQADL